MCFFQTLIGVGTTPRGQQLKPFYPVDTSTDVVLSVIASHGTPLYVTAIVENFAGLRSVFRSKELIIDHTPPVVEDVLVETLLNASTHQNATLGRNKTTVRFNVTWNAIDDESGIQMCFLSIGM